MVTQPATGAPSAGRLRGRALLAAIAEFDQRAYTGSRIVLLVSDGGAQLDVPTRQRIAAGLQRNRIALYWLYLKSVNGPVLDASAPLGDGSSPELALHRFFVSLATPYRAYQAEEPAQLAQAIADVGRQQNLPFDYAEQVPREDHSRTLLALAAGCCVLLPARPCCQKGKTPSPSRQFPDSDFPMDRIR